MKTSKKRIVLIVLGIIAIVILSFVAYFYVALSGNPLVMWQQKQAVLRIYEDRYDEDFKVIRSTYDYKRGEYFYTLEPENNPHFKFSTSVFESTEHDIYAELRAEEFIKQIVEEALHNRIEFQTVTLNIHEQHTTFTNTETDVSKRLRQNTYVASVSTDVDNLEPEEVDTAAKEMGDIIDSVLNTTIGGLTLRISVYDGTNYHFAEVDIR